MLEAPSPFLRSADIRAGTRELSVGHVANGGLLNLLARSDRVSMATILGLA
jgi:hypothetical protein